MSDLMTGLGDVKTKTAEALRATEADGGASVVRCSVAGHPHAMITRWGRYAAPSTSRGPNR